MNSHDLKELNTRKKKLWAERNALFEERAALHEKIEGVTKNLTAVVHKIDKLLQGDPVVTEHAILRYLERKFNLDLNEIKKEILPTKVIQQYKALGDGKFPIGDKKAVIKNNYVVTVI